MKFAFIAKHRGIWPAEWLCGALGVSRGGFYGWLRRPSSERSRSNEELGAKVRTSFLNSDRTYGARCQCRFKFPQMCRSKIPQSGGISVISRLTGDRWLHVWVDDRGGAAAVPGLAS